LRIENNAFGRQAAIGRVLPALVTFTFTLVINQCQK